MKKHVIAVNDTDTIDEAIEKMDKNEITKLIVIDKEGDVKGILQLSHIYRDDVKQKKQISEIQLDKYGTVTSDTNLEEAYPIIKSWSAVVVINGKLENNKIENNNITLANVSGVVTLTDYSRYVGDDTLVFN
jgi:CBS domain-containing protein